MDLSTKSPENVAFMVEEIKKKLRMASGAAMSSTNFDEDRYEDLVDLYELVASKNSFSISEIDAITSELGKLRKTNG